MAIANYTELQQEIGDWFHRGDLTAKIPVFIQLGEAYLNRKVRAMDMETRATLNTGTISRYVPFPDRFLEMISLSLKDGDNWDEISFVDSSVFREFVQGDTTQSKPTLFTAKDEIEFNFVPDAVYQLEAHYLKKYDIVADSTNWLLTNYPDLYLYASILSGSMYIKNDSRVAGIKGLMDEAIRELNKQEARKRGNNLVLQRVDDAITSNGAYNIMNG